MRRSATLRRVKSDERRQVEQDTGGFPDNKPEGVNCRTYHFVDECKNVKGGKTECEGHCTNNHNMFGSERRDRYRCRWQGKESGCRSSTGRLKYQKCLHGTCLKPEEKA